MVAAGRRLEQRLADDLPAGVTVHVNGTKVPFTVKASYSEPEVADSTSYLHINTSHLSDGLWDMFQLHGE